MTDIQKCMGFGSLILLAWLLYLLSPVLTPFLMGAVLAYLGDPFVDFLEKHKLPRSLAVVIVFLVLILITIVLLLLILPMFQRQLVILLGKIPIIIEWLEQIGLPWVLAQAGLHDVQSNLDGVKQIIGKNWSGASGLLGGILGTVTESGLAIIVWIGNLVLIPVVTFYLLRDWDILMERLRQLLPKHIEPIISALARQCDQVIGAFVKGQMLVMLALGFIYSLGLAIAGLELALLVGMLAGTASIVPYLGFIIGMLVAGIAALVQFGELSALLPVLIVFSIGQMLEGMVLTPLLVGDKIGLHPVAVIFAVLAGGQLFGFFGILLALPIAAIIMVLLRHGHERYIASSIYSKSIEKSSGGG